MTSESSVPGAVGPVTHAALSLAADGSWHGDRDNLRRQLAIVEQEAAGGAVGEREEPLDVAAEVAYEMKVFLHGAKMAPPVAPGWIAQIEKWMARLSVNEGGVAPRCSCTWDDSRPDHHDERIPDPACPIHGGLAPVEPQ